MTETRIQELQQELTTAREEAAKTQEEVDSLEAEIQEVIDRRKKIGFNLFNGIK